MQIYLLVSIVAIIISFIGFSVKAAYPLWQTLIPGYNFYIIARILYVRVLLMIAIISYFFVPDKMMVITPLYILMTFMLADAYNKGLLYSILMLLFPAVFYPLLAFTQGEYIYNNVYMNSQADRVEVLVEETLIDKEPELLTSDTSSAIAPTELPNIITLVPPKPVENGEVSK